jgi:quercetin dioxygenase-like cupin family protein
MTDESRRVLTRTADAVFATASDDGYVDALPGIRRRTLTYGSATMLIEFRLDAGAALPVHAHPQEQTGYLVAGRIRLTVGEETRVVGPGDGWSIPAGVPHGGEALDDAVAVEVFSPVREDYLS